MKAVNLIPVEERRGGGGAAGKSGGAAYILLGLLGMLVIMAAAYTLAGKSVSDRKSDLQRTRAEATAVQSKADELAPYTRFSQLREQRVQTVQSLAGSRFDWSKSMHEVARVVPSNVWLTSMTGTVAPGVQLEGAAGSSGSLRSAMPVPAIEIVGCTTSQRNVSRFISRMRLVKGVQRVSLGSAEKADAAGGGGGGGGTDCRNGSASFPQFQLVIFFNAPAPAASAAPATPAAPGATPAPAAGAAQTASQTTPTADGSAK
jgi:Tfp pilus assembly protein PilN